MPSIAKGMNESHNQKIFIPYLAGLLGMYCLNLHLPLKGSSCSSIVTHSLGINVVLHLVKNNSHMCLNAAMWSVFNLSALVRLSSNLSSLRISSYLRTDIVALYTGFWSGSEKSSRTESPSFFLHLPTESIQWRQWFPHSQFFSTLYLLLQLLGDLPNLYIGWLHQWCHAL